MLSYFVRDSIEFNDLASLGLAHICEDSSKFVKRQIISGFESYHWAIGSTETISEARIGYYPGRQEIQDFGSFAIARDTESKFDPACLLRSSAVDSHPWQDWNGNTWKIPIARRWVDGMGGLAVDCALPRFLSIDQSGDWVYGGVVSKYEKLWKLANKYFSDSMEAIKKAHGDTYTVPLPSLDDICDVVFGANYRVSKYEIAFLKVFLVSSNHQIMKLVADDPGFEELQKKTV
jgi:hypothetical protein